LWRLALLLLLLGLLLGEGALGLRLAHLLQQLLQLGLLGLRQALELAPRQQRLPPLCCRALQPLADLQQAQQAQQQRRGQQLLLLQTLQQHQRQGDLAAWPLQQQQQQHKQQQLSHEASAAAPAAYRSLMPTLGPCVPLLTEASIPRQRFVFCIHVSLWGSGRAPPWALPRSLSDQHHCLRHCDHRYL
jgi:hypothetical protein